MCEVMRKHVEGETFKEDREHAIKEVFFGALNQTSEDLNTNNQPAIQHFLPSLSFLDLI